MLINPLGAPNMKTVDLGGKHKQLTSNSFHPSICLKSSDGTLEKIKNEECSTRNKRLDRMKIEKGERCIVIEIEIEGQKEKAELNDALSTNENDAIDIDSVTGSRCLC